MNKDSRLPGTTPVPTFQTDLISDLQDKTWQDFPVLGLGENSAVYSVSGVFWGEG